MEIDPRGPHIAALITTVVLPGALGALGRLVTVRTRPPRKVYGRYMKGPSPVHDRYIIGSAGSNP